MVANEPFSILGYAGRHYFFYHNAKDSVISCHAEGIGEMLMLELAPINWWEECFPNALGSFDVAVAANWIFRTAESAGYYNDGDVGKLKAQHKKEWNIPRVLFNKALADSQQTGVDATHVEKMSLARIAADTLLALHIGECNAYGIKFDHYEYFGEDGAAEDAKLSEQVSS